MEQTSMEVLEPENILILKKQPKKAAKKFNRNGIITRNPDKCEMW